MFNTLPDDILLRIIDNLNPLDIIQLRLACTRFNVLTRAHIVWVNAYRNPDLFVPPISISSTSTAELERIVLQSAKLEQNWTCSSPTPTSVISRKVHDTRSSGMVSFLHLFYGRYLVVGFRKSFVLYDLEGSEQPVFEETHQNFGYFTAYHAQHCDAYCADSRPYLSVSLRQSLDIWELCLDQHPHMRQAAQIDAGYNLVVDISHNYVYLQDFIFHVPTQRMYKLNVGLNDPATWKLPMLGGKVMPGRVLVMRYHRSQMSLESFDIPELGDSREILNPTHSTLFDLQLADISLISCSPRQLKVFAYSGPSVRQVCWNITLEDDGSITIQPWGPDVQHSYGSYVTANGYGKARVVSISARPNALEPLSGYTISCDGAGDPVVEIRPLHGLGQLGFSNCMAFDGYRGRLCLSCDGGTLYMFDYV